METALVVCQYLIKGAISYAGGLALKSAIGGATITDVRTWIREAVVELEEFIADKLDQMVMQQMAADLDQTKENIGEYASLPSGKLRINRYLIQDADTHTSALVALSLNYKQAYSVSMAAMAYWCFARQALYLDDKAAGHITSMKDSIDDFMIRGSATYRFLLDQRSPDRRLRVACEVEGDLPPQGDIPGEPGWWECWVELDGHEVGGCDARDDHDEARAARQSRACSDAKIRPAVQAQYDKFKSDALMPLQLIATCYARMCKEIGGQYTPPPGLPFDIAGVSIVRPTPTLLMPGAIVMGNAPPAN